MNRRNSRKAGLLILLNLINLSLHSTLYFTSKEYGLHDYYSKLFWPFESSDKEYGGWILGYSTPELIIYSSIPIIVSLIYYIFTRARE